jgi:hypothetical protein
MVGFPSSLHPPEIRRDGPDRYPSHRRGSLGRVDSHRTTPFVSRSCGEEIDKPVRTLSSTIPTPYVLDCQHDLVDIVHTGSATSTSRKRVTTYTPPPNSASRSGLPTSTTWIRVGRPFTTDLETGRIPVEFRLAQGRWPVLDHPDRSDTDGGSGGAGARRRRAGLRRAQQPRPAVRLSASASESRPTTAISRTATASSSSSPSIGRL